MPRPTPGVRSDLASRLADLERQTPEWRACLRLLRVVHRTLDDQAWDAPFAEAGVEHPADADRPGAPLLQGRRLTVDAGWVSRLVHRLTEIAAAEGAGRAASLGGYRPSPAAAVRLLATAVRQDRAGIHALAAAAGVDPAALDTVAQFAALPLLQSCRRLLQDRIQPFWPHRYCPICAGRPILAERRGIDQTRQLRCGRCGGDWQIPWLCCAYCGEADHDQLGSLVPDGQQDSLKVETCARCRGYLKSVATLQGVPPFELLLRDLETVALDLVALSRGYSRPEGSGFPLDLSLDARPARRIWKFGRQN